MTFKRNVMAGVALIAVSIIDAVAMNVDHFFGQLMNACTIGDMQTFQGLLLQHPEYINKQDASGATLIIKAIENRHNEIVSFLIMENAKLDIGDNVGINALMASASFNNLESTIYILRKNIDLIDSVDGYTSTALMHAAEKGHIEIARILINSGASLNMADFTGYTALMYASIYNRKDMVSLLIEKKANIHMVDHDGTTALMHAIDEGNTEIVVILAKLVSDINAVVNWQGQTRLTRAVMDNDVKTATFLLQNDANPFLPDESGRSGYTLAEWGGNKEMIYAFTVFGTHMYDF